MDCPPHLWDLDQRSFGVCRHCHEGKQFERPGEPQTLSWHRGAKTEPVRRGRPPKATVASVAPPKEVAVRELQHNMHANPGASGYFGVTQWRGGWKARICVDRVQRHLGLFPTAIDAARAYNVAALAGFGSGARLNELPADAGHEAPPEPLARPSPPGRLKPFTRALRMPRGEDGPKVCRARSGYWGVHPKRGKFSAKLMVRGESIFIGTFDDAISAARAYNATVLRSGIKTARLNELPAGGANNG